MQDNLPIFNWKPQFDERSRNYAVAEVLPEKVKRRSKLWRPGTILDQGREGACVGFGWTAEAIATPVAVDLSRLAADPETDPNKFAHNLYELAKTLDDTPGEDYEGTSVLAGAKAMQQRGLVKQYRWCFNFDDVIDSIISKGPVVLGIYWYDGMYEAPNGVLSVTGKEVGGHCIAAVGFKLAKDSATGEDSIVLQNSWGSDWGNNGLAEIRASELADLLKDDGEACVPVKRSYGYAKKK